MCEEHELTSPHISTESINALQAYDWPGNIRELRNHIERSLLLSIPLHETLPVADTDSATTNKYCLKSLEKEHILKVINESKGNKSQAAKSLGISRRTLDRKLKRWDQKAA